MINLLLPDQIKELHLLESVIAVMPDAESGARALVERVADILAVPVALVERRRSAWITIAEAGDGAPAPVATIAAALPATAVGQPPAVAESQSSGASWTGLCLRPSAERPLWLLLSGDWRLSEVLLRDVGEHLMGALNGLRARAGAASRRARAALVLARRLARISDPARACQLIVDTCAYVVHGTKASLALYDEDQRVLVMAATHGYPAILVRHMRFQPGVGIIGSVFRTRRPLRIADVRQLSGAPQPRPRYRTTSFLAVPLVGSAGAVGVLCVSDRADGQAFTVEDLTALRALAGVASLAVDRARALELASARQLDAALDPLTGLFNRRYFHARLEEEVERARRHSAPLSLIMLDLDNFKEFNDQLGHPAGDALLRAVADVLRRSVRLFDVCARFGGDEFAILMSGGGGETGIQIASRIREEIENCRPLGVPATGDLRVSASIGISSAVVTSAAELISHADQALYAAKREGKNRITRSVAADPPAIRSDEARLQ